MNKFVYAGVKMTTDQLTNEELAAIYTAVTAGFDPRSVLGYVKAKSLFTEFNETKMHADTLKALDVIVGERLG